MENQQNNMFNSISEIEPPKYLKEVVLGKILLAKKKQARRKKVAFNFAFALSGISIFTAGCIFGKELIASDFWAISMLGFTDMKALANNWQEFFLSLMETFPAVSVAGILMPVFITMLLLKEYAQSQQFKFKLN